MPAINNIFSHTELQADDILMSLNSNSLPLKQDLTKTGRCIVSYCLDGSAEIEVNLVKHKFERAGIIMLFPNQIVQQKHISNDLSVMYFSIAPHILQEVTFRFPQSFLNFMQTHFYFTTSEVLMRKEQKRFLGIYNKLNDNESFCRRELVLNLLRIYFLEMYDKIQKADLINTNLNHSRKTELYQGFTKLVMVYYKVNREVKFYANQLCISPTYLTRIVMEACDYGAKQWIDNYSILELKVRIKSSSDSLQLIADEFHFSDLAYMSNYFKSNTGMTPSEFRNG